MLRLSTRKDKRLMLVLHGKKIHFGSINGYTYVDGASEKTKENYILRHGNEDWTTINPGSLSRYILWGNSRDIEKNADAYADRFLNGINLLV